MKKVVLYQDSSGSLYTEDSNTSLCVGSAAVGCLQEYKEPVNDIVIKLASSGMSVEDIIKLKHGGVLQ